MQALILDVKFRLRRVHANLKAEARKLARAMVALGNECGTNTRAILTDMNTPLQNAPPATGLKSKESVECLEPLVAMFVKTWLT